MIANFVRNVSERFEDRLIQESLQSLSARIFCSFKLLQAMSTKKSDASGFIWQVMINLLRVG
jgi:hypothetical protein